MQLEEARTKIAKLKDMVAGFEAQLSTPDAAKQLVLLQLVAGMRHELGALRQHGSCGWPHLRVRSGTGGRLQQDGGRGECRKGWGRATRGCLPAVLLLPLLGSSPW